MRALLFFCLSWEILIKYHKGDFNGHCSVLWLEKRGGGGGGGGVYEALTTFSIVNEYYKRYYKVGRGVSGTTIVVPI